MSGLSRFPFTPSQWQELEHQALVFKYIINGMPVPPDLLLNIKRSCLDSTMSSKYLSHHTQHVGWNCFQMGIGKKIDPEPGRCRRTDGKKWRCSKEAYPDSKYCERHMHRGKNRSRKPVEVITNSNTNTNTASSTNITTNTTTTTTTTKTPPYSFNSTSQSLSSVFSSETTHHHHYPSTYSQYSHMGPASYSLSYHHSSSSRPHHSSLGFSSQDNSSSYLLDNHSDYRYFYGVKESNEHEHEHAFFTEPSGAVRSFTSSSMDDSWQLTPLTMSTTSSSSTKQRGFSALNSDYSYLQLQTSKQQQDHHNNHHPHQFYALGSEMKEQQQQHQPQKTIHRFFDDGTMDKTRDGSSTWLDLDDKSSNSSSMSTTKLSISMPSSSNDFPIFNSRRQHHHDG